ncbi:MAG: hypothetical protein K2Q26_09495 [Bdellovibrionales bacterium]|nr:hypothetical protein [Bdellovibrionales bacterium]
MLKSVFGILIMAVSFFAATFSQSTAFAYGACSPQKGYDNRGYANTAEGQVRWIAPGLNGSFAERWQCEDRAVTIKPVNFESSEGDEPQTPPSSDGAEPDFSQDGWSGDA